MKTRLILLAATTAFLSSCGDSNSIDETSECSFTQNGYVSSAVAPAAGSVNVPINIDVKIPVMNGCGQFSKFIESHNGLKHNVIAETKYYGCVCTAEAPVRTAVYTFTPQIAGQHIVTFPSGSGSFISDTIVVN